MNLPLLTLGIMIISGSYLMTIIVLDSKSEDWFGIERNMEKPKRFWLFNILNLMVTIMLGAVNSTFLWFAYWDANRRIYLMRQVSNSLELDF